MLPFPHPVNSFIGKLVLGIVEILFVVDLIEDIECLGPQIEVVVDHIVVVVVIRIVVGVGHIVIMVIHIVVVAHKQLVVGHKLVVDRMGLVDQIVLVVHMVEVGIDLGNLVDL